MPGSQNSAEYPTNWSPTSDSIHSPTPESEVGLKKQNYDTLSAAKFPFLAQVCH